jgi:hypothetical protein
MSTEQDVLDHIDAESHQILKSLEEAFNICSDEGRRIKSIAEEDSMITQQLDK